MAINRQLRFPSRSVLLSISNSELGDVLYYMCTVDRCLSVLKKIQDGSYRISFLIQIQFLLHFRAMSLTPSLRKTPPYLICQTIFFIWIHESSVQLKRIKPGTHSQLQLKRPSSFLAAYYSQVTLDKFRNPQISQPTTYNHSSLMHERQFFSKREIERGAIWVGVQLCSVGGAACFCC